MGLLERSWWQRLVGERLSFAVLHLTTGFWPTKAERAKFERFRSLYDVLPRKGGVFEGFRALSVVTGSYGLVYEVEPAVGPGPRSALKVLRPDLIDDPVAQARLAREQAVMRVLDHPQIAKWRSQGAVRDLLFEGELRELPYFEMEYLAGPCLATVMTSSSKVVRPTPKRFAEIIAAVCDPVQALHAHRMVHRDLRPSNMVLTPDRVVLTGLGGISVPADAVDPPPWQGEDVGVLGFMSPQQVRGEPPHPTDDVFSLGATLYRGVYGVSVYGQGTEEYIRRVSRAGWIVAPRRVLYQRPFEDVVARATASEAADRYPSVAEFKKALADALRYLPG